MKGVGRAGVHGRQDQAEEAGGGGCGVAAGRGGVCGAGGDEQLHVPDRREPPGGTGGTGGAARASGGVDRGPEHAGGRGAGARGGQGGGDPHRDRVQARADGARQRERGGVSDVGGGVYAAFGAFDSGETAGAQGGVLPQARRPAGKPGGACGGGDPARAAGGSRGRDGRVRADAGAARGGHGGGACDGGAVAVVRGAGSRAGAAGWRGWRRGRGPGAWRATTWCITRRSGGCCRTC